MTPNVEILEVELTTLGEGPFWDDEKQCLYYVDTIKQTINKYDPSTKKHTKADIGNNLSIIIPVKGKDNQFVITFGRQIALITWDGESSTVEVKKILYEVDENTENVFNDGKCDPCGRLWAGTMGSAPKNDGGKIPPVRGSLYHFQNGEVTKHLMNIGIANGLAFDKKLNKFYYIDSYKGTLDQYDLDLTNGAISNGKPIFTLFEKFEEGTLKVLDGMTIDTDGNLWVAVFNEGRVIKVDPRKPGRVAESISFPANLVTSVAFGGPNLDELYVTSGRLNIQGVKTFSPCDGRLFRVTGLNAKGLTADRVIL